MMKLSFDKLDDVSSWEVHSKEIRYCPITEREYTVAERLRPSMYLRGEFKLYVN